MKHKANYESIFRKGCMENVCWNSPSMTYFTYSKKKFILKIFKKLEQEKNKLNILDIGCADGTDLFMLNKLSSKRNKFFGIDISKLVIEKAKYIKKRNNFKNFFFNKIDITKTKLGNIFQKEFFDLVIISEVIEHVPTKVQKNLIKETKKIMKNGGVLIITTPNKNTVVKKIFFNTKLYKKILKKTFLFYEKSKGKEQHIAELSWKDLNKIVKKEFKIEKCGGWNISYGSPLLDNSNFLLIIWIIFNKVFSLLFPFWCYDMYIVARKV